MRDDLGLYVVADGAGGHNAGKVASSLAIKSITNYFEATLGEARGEPSVDAFGLRSAARRLGRAIQKANHDVVEISRAAAEHRGMGSTVVAIAVDVWDAVVHVAHVGDSRCYREREGQLEQRSRTTTRSSTTSWSCAPTSPTRRSRSFRARSSRARSAWRPRCGCPCARSRSPTATRSCCARTASRARSRTPGSSTRSSAIATRTPPRRTSSRWRTTQVGATTSRLSSCAASSRGEALVARRRRAAARIRRRHRRGVAGASPARRRGHHGRRRRREGSHRAPRARR